VSNAEEIVILLQPLLVILFEGSREECVKSTFLHFSFLLPCGALKCVLSNSINRLGENMLGTKM
jgi:hypothetical protein